MPRTPQLLPAALRVPSLWLLAFVAGLGGGRVVAAGAAVHQATGFKVVEPAATSVTIWTRVTRDAARVPDTGPLPETHVFDRASGQELPIKNDATYANGRPVITFPPGVDLGSIRGAAVGAAGETRVRFRVVGTPAWVVTPWQAVDPQRDFTGTFALTALRPATRYEVEVEARPAGATEASSRTSGGFATAPAPGADAGVVFCVMSCQQYEHHDRPDGFAIYPAMQRLRPDFFVNTGDAVYYDHGPVHALNADLARYHWARMFSWPTLRDFHQTTASYFMKDDHDVLTNDSEPGMRTGDFTFAEGLRIFHEQTGLPRPSYRTQRWGRHLQVWLVEGRDFRTPAGADQKTGRSIWGAEQIAWLERTLAASDATFRVLIVATPIVGPDRPSKDDNYSNPGFAEEGAKVRALLGRFKNLVVITGDRHWQYVSADPATGLEEWSVGAASDAHAGGWNETEPRPMHRFLKIKSGGFLSGEVQPAAGAATLALRLHDTAGTVVYRSAKSAALK